MRLSSILSSISLLAITVNSNPLGRSQRRAENIVRSLGLSGSRGLSHANTTVTNTVEDGTATTIESDNWTGAVIQSPPTGTKFVGVSGTLTIPKPTLPEGASINTWYYGLGWVGIDGDFETCDDILAQGGVLWGVKKSSSGTLSYTYAAWYEWLPNYFTDFTGITLSAGDVINMSFLASSTSKGVVTIEDVTTGVTVKETITSPSTAYDLCELSAEWIVEDYTECVTTDDCSLVPFADFGSVTWTNTEATLSNGDVVGNTGAATVLLYPETTAITSVDIVSSSEIVITYTG